MSRAVAWPTLTAESGIDRHFKEIQRFPMLDPQEEYKLAKRWRRDGARDAADRLVHEGTHRVLALCRSSRWSLVDLKGSDRINQMGYAECFTVGALAPFRW
jgi:hypothetical protein